MSSPFDPPRDVVEVEQARASLLRWALVVGTWGCSWACLGTAVGVARTWLGHPGEVVTWGAVGMVGGALAGVAALVVERMGAARRPEVVGASGVPERPLHGSALMAPLLGVATPGLGALAVVSTLVLDSIGPSLVFGLGAASTLWAAHRVWAQHRLARGLEAYQVGDGTGPLQRVATSRWAPGVVRDGARVNLAMAALRKGEAVEALRWLRGEWRGPAAAWAAAGRSLAWLLEDHLDESEAALREALVLPGRAAVNAELDAVRVLLVWRQSGPDAAHDLAERLHGPGSSALHRALLGVLHAERGDDARAEQLLSSPGVLDLARSGLGGAIDELSGLTRALPRAPPRAGP